MITMTTPKTEAFNLTIPLDAIQVSKTNPRTHFDEKKLGELADSISKHGVIVPVLVRPIMKKTGVPGTGPVVAGYELVAGERRFRAAQMVKLDAVPAIVRDLDDKATLEIQVIENLQREDLHPLEEAEGYARLIKSHGYDADQLALKIGKSRSYIYGRMKLAELCEPAKKALWDGKISHSIGLIIARIPDEKLQVDALKQIIARNGYGDAMSYRQAAEYIQGQFMLKLNTAPWKLADAELVAAAGPCTTCPMRTGNQKELFDDVKSADVCTSPRCYENKLETFMKREAAAKGWETLPESESKRVFQYGGTPGYDSGYEDLDAKCWKDPKQRTYSQLLPDAPVILARDRELELAVANAVGAKLATAVEKVGITGPILRALLMDSIENGGMRIDEVLERRGIEASREDQYIAKLSDHELLGLVVEDLFAGKGFGSQSKQRREAVLKSLKVDESGIRSAVSTALKKKWSEEDRAKKKGAKKAKARR